MICLVCPPAHLRIEQAINSFQVEALANPPDRERALAQHEELVGALSALGVEVLEVEPIPAAPYQVFLRDVLIGGLGTPLVASLREPVRRLEAESVRTALGRASIPFVESAGGHLEGGDVVVDGRDLFVGVGDRTESSAADWLRATYSSEFRVHVLEMRPGYLHLDMVFNVVDSGGCVVFPPALQPESYALVRRLFDRCLEIEAGEQRSMSTNFLPVGESAAIASTTITAPVREALTTSGRQLHLVELAEIQKCGGSVRCSTCLL